MAKIRRLNELAAGRGQSLAQMAWPGIGFWLPIGLIIVTAQASGLLF